MFLGYNTNGLTHHRLTDTVELLAEIGYRGVAITIDHQALPPPEAIFEQSCHPAGEAESSDARSADVAVLPAVVLDRLGRLKEQLEALQLQSVIETGARFLLDPCKKHEPTLLTPAAEKRILFYRYAIDCAAFLGSDCVSIWSGVLHPSVSRQEALTRLAIGLDEVLDYAARKGVAIAFEPEPGMLIDSMAAFAELLDRIDRPNLRLTLDVGHLHCQGETPIAAVIQQWASRLGNVHLEDMCRGHHEHLMFGEGEIDFPPIFEALSEIGYSGGVYVELSRHSGEGLRAAKRAWEWLKSRAVR